MGRGAKTIGPHHPNLPSRSVPRPHHENRLPARLRPSSRETSRSRHSADSPPFGWNISRGSPASRHLRKCDKISARTPLFPKAQSQHASDTAEISPASEGLIVPNSYGCGNVSVLVPPRYDQTSGNDATPENGPCADRCAFPEDRILNDRRTFDHATLTDRVKPSEASAGVDLGIVGNARRPRIRAEIIGPPAARADYLVDLKVFGARSDIEPFTLVEDHTANLA